MLLRRAFRAPVSTLIMLQFALLSLTSSPADSSIASPGNSSVTSQPMAVFGSSAAWGLQRGGAPWTEPEGRFQNATVVAALPGIWTVRDFASEDEVARVLSALPPPEEECPENHPGSFDETCWGKCKGAAHDEQVGKVCTKLSAAKEEDPAVKAVIRRAASVWEGERAPDGLIRASVDVMKYKVGAGPTLVHRDVTSGNSLSSASLAIYLTQDENQAAVVWPHINVSIRPIRGAAAAWLNALPCGKASYEALHGVEAAPANATGDRVVLFGSTVFSEKRFAAARRRLEAQGHRGRALTFAPQQTVDADHCDELQGLGVAAPSDDTMDTSAAADTTLGATALHAQVIGTNEGNDELGALAIHGTTAPTFAQHSDIIANHIGSNALHSFADHGGYFAAQKD